MDEKLAEVTITWTGGGTSRIVMGINWANGETRKILVSDTNLEYLGNEVETNGKPCINEACSDAGCPVHDPPYPYLPYSGFDYFKTYKVKDMTVTITYRCEYCDWNVANGISDGSVKNCPHGGAVHT